VKKYPEKQDKEATYGHPKIVVIHRRANGVDDQTHLNKSNQGEETLCPIELGQTLMAFLAIGPVHHRNPFDGTIGAAKSVAPLFGDVFAQTGGAAFGQAWVNTGQFDLEALWDFGIFCHDLAFMIGFDVLIK